MEILIIIFIIYLIISGGNDEDLEDDNLNWRENINYKEKGEQFYHPVTGYKGTKSEMDAYIINRERKLNEED